MHFTTSSLLLSLCALPLSSAGGVHDLLHARSHGFSEEINLHKRSDNNFPVRRTISSDGPRLEARRNVFIPPTFSRRSTSAAAAAAAFNTTAWDLEATTACTSALAGTTSVDNPTGMALCYNLPFVDNTTGVFEADLRLYQVESPSGAFAGLTPQDISVKLSYFFASISSTVAASSTTTTTKRDDASLIERDLSVLPRATKFLQTFVYVGQIEKALVIDLPLVNATSMRQLLIPEISLFSTKVTPTANTTITSSKDTKTYLVGPLSDPSSATVTSEVASAASASAIVAAATAFVLPGTSLGIFPVGLIVTGSWVALFFAVVGYGTIGRVQFRNAYRRRASGRS